MFASSLFISSLYFSFWEKEKGWTINFNASELELNFVLPAQVEVGALVFIFFPPYIFFSLRDVEASCWLLRAGNGLFLRGVWRRTTPLSFGGKQAMCIPLFLSSACFIFASACVPATNRTLSSVFASLNSWICDKLAGEPNTRFNLIAFVCARFVPFSLTDSDNSSPSVI